MNLKTSHIPPRRILAITVGVIFIAEAVIMAILWQLPIHKTLTAHLLADAAVLSFIVLPILIFVVYRPMNRYVAERKLAEEALRESEAKLRGLYELSPLGIALTDMKGHYIEFNESFRRICGYTDEEVKKGLAKVVNWMKN